MAASNRPEPWSAKDQTSFAFESTARRWPTILTQAVDALYNAAAALSSSSSASDTAAKVEESKVIIEKLAKLKHDIGRDRPLEKLTQDGGPNVTLYNDIIERDSPTWFNAAWLFAECYMYRLIRVFFDESTHWKYYDPFSNQKLSAFKSSGTAIEQLSKTVEELCEKAANSSKDSAAQSDEGQKLAFMLLSQSSLWGNATDLSLLTSLTHADIQDLQKGGIGADAQKGKERFILTGLGPLESAWEALKANRGGRVDIVFDNSGFELVSDLMLAQWLVATGLASEVVFHAKAIPWFVSDVTPPDFAFTLEALQEPGFFHDTDPKQVQVPSDSQQRATDRSASRSRSLQADASQYSSGNASSPAPAGSRSLQMQMPAGDQQSSASPHPAGSRDLQAHPDVASAAGADADSRGRGRSAANVPAGSRQLTMDPAYFQNSRSRTVSPSRSFLVDSTRLSFAALSVEAEKAAEPARSSPALTRQVSGFRSSKSSSTATQRLATTWSRYVRDGHFKLSVPVTTKLGERTGLSGQDFWTEGTGYDQLPQVAPGLLDELKKSGLVLFKGDLNYRKLTGDLRWPATAPFAESLGELAGHFNLLSLRTCKADVVVGLTEGVEEKVKAEDENWRINGKYAVIGFSAKQ